MSLNRLGFIEESSLEKIAVQKKEVFHEGKQFGLEEYDKFRLEINGILEKNADWQDKAVEFLQLWKKVADTLNDPEDKSYTFLAAVQIFERSFEFFKNEVSADVKTIIAEEQLNFLCNTNLDPELLNYCKGIWGYYVSTEKYLATHDAKTDDDYFKSKSEIVTALNKIYSSDKKNDGLRAKYLSMANSGSLRYEGEEADTVRYFSDLYAHDREALEMLPVESKQQSGQSKTKETPSNIRRLEFKTGVPMPPHVKFYCFEHNYLPTPETLDRSILAISDDPRLQTNPKEGIVRRLKGEREGMVFDQMPPEFLFLYVSRLNKIRGENSYRKATKEEREKVRIDAVKTLISEIFDFNSEIWLELKSKYSDREIQRLQNSLNKFKPENVNLAFVIAYNYDKALEAAAK